MSITERKDADDKFFEAVAREAAWMDVRARLSFDEQRILPSQRNSVLLLTRKAWYLPALPGQSKVLNVHFEARRRDELRLEIAIDPYEGNVESKPDLYRKVK